MNRNMKWFIGIFLTLSFIVAVVNVSTQKDVEYDETKEDENPKQKTKVVKHKVENSKTLTYKKYISIKKGMTYQQVVNIVGKGEELSSSDMAGYKTVVRMWKGSLGSNMILTFQNDKLIVKAQFGLK